MSYIELIQSAHKEASLGLRDRVLTLKTDLSNVQDLSRLKWESCNREMEELRSEVDMGSFLEKDFSKKAHVETDLSVIALRIKHLSPTFKYHAKFRFLLKKMKFHKEAERLLKEEYRSLPRSQRGVLLSRIRKHRKAQYSVRSLMRSLHRTTYPAYG